MAVMRLRAATTSLQDATQEAIGHGVGTNNTFVHMPRETEVPCWE